MTIAAMPYIDVDQAGVARVAGSCIGVYRLAMTYSEGGGIDRLNRAFPQLTLAQIHAALAYYYDHQEVIDAHIRREREDWDRRTVKDHEAFERQLAEDRRAYESMCDEIRKKYPNQYVAIAFGRIVAVDDDFRKAAAAVDALEPQPEHSVVFRGDEAPPFESYDSLSVEML